MKIADRLNLLLQKQGTIVPHDLPKVKLGDSQIFQTVFSVNQVEPNAKNAIPLRQSEFIKANKGKNHNPNNRYKEPPLYSTLSGELYRDELKKVPTFN
jgi:hypothetical protein